MQFGFMPGRGTTAAIFILSKLQEKYLSKKKDTYFMFVDFGKAFDRVPCKVLWWEMRTIGVEEWIILTVAAFYKFAGSKVCVNGKFSEEFGVKVGVHDHADDQVISAESINELVEIPSVEI